MENPVTDNPLSLNVDRETDYLLAIEFGEICDGRPDSEYIAITDDVAWVLREAGGDVIGFIVHRLDRFDAEAVDELWTGPRFDVPVLGLRSAHAGEIVLCADATFFGQSTTDRMAFHTAVEQDPHGNTEILWRVCLGTGCLEAHFALGYTLCEQGRFRDAYRHLRYYTELAPRNAWAWNWLGQSCVSLGELAEARTAFERAVELEEAGSFETDAYERLQELAEGE